MMAASTQEEIDIIRAKGSKYELRNRTQKLIMKEIVWYHDLVYMKSQPRFHERYFHLKLYLYKKYKIEF